MLVPSCALSHLLPARTMLPSLVTMFPSPTCSQPTWHKQETLVFLQNRLFPKMEHSRDLKGSVAASQSKLWSKLVGTSSAWSWFCLHGWAKKRNSSRPIHVICVQLHPQISFANVQCWKLTIAQNLSPLSHFFLCCLIFLCGRKTCPASTKRAEMDTWSWSGGTWGVRALF